MGNFRREGRGFGGGRDNRRGGFGGGRGRSFGGRDSGGFGGERRRFEMHKVVCDKCGEECEVPFKPTGDKPVYCSACFEKQGNTSERRSRFAEPSSGGSSGISQEQFNELNSKLDKILEILDMIEFEEDEEAEEGEEETA